jgi:hypothetical protein
MTRRKENPVETVPPTTAITKVIPVVEETKTLLETAEHPGEASDEYAQAIEAVRTAVDNFCRSTWRLAWSLVDFRQVHERVHPSNRLTDKQMANVLGIRLTPARIGQLVNTAVAYPREQVDESIDFRVYEQARTKNPRMTPAKLLKLVKDHPTTAAIAKLKPASCRETTIQQELMIRVTPAAEQDAEPVISVRLNGTAIELPADLKNDICKYARNSFVETKDN